MSFFDSLGGIWDSASGFVGETTDWLSSTAGDLLEFGEDVSDVLDGVWGDVGGIIGGIGGGGGSTVVLPPPTPPLQDPDLPPLTDVGIPPPASSSGLSGNMLLIAGGLAVLVFLVARK